MTKQAHIYFSGEVQGVGFRFTARSVARDSGILGYVKNLDDGSVEVVAEGSDERLEDFINNIKESFKNYIRDVNIDYSYPTGEFKDFQIRF